MPTGREQTARARRQRFWRLGTVLPAVLTACAGMAVMVTVRGGIGIADASVTDRSPIAHLDDLHRTPGGARVVGWTYDPDSPKSTVRVYATVDHKVVKAGPADVSRSDVGRAHPSAGPKHGFNWFVPVPQGTHLLCVSAVDIGKGSNTLLTCTRRDFEYSPFGKFDSLTAGHGLIHARGWVMDSDNLKAAVTTTVTVDGTAHTFAAKVSRPDVANARAGAGPLHGFDVKYSVAQGKHTVCVSAKNIGYGSNTSLGCKTVTLNDSPRGTVENIKQQSGKLYVNGWTFDPDAATSPVTVVIKIDGTAHSVVANGSRTDVAKAYPSAGKYHGFGLYFGLAEGSHTVCVTLRNVSFGRDVSVPCRTIVLNFTPSAALTGLAATSTGMKATGWASDPDTSGAISARISVDGKTATTIKAAAKGSTHSGHDFSLALRAKSGSHTVCVVGLNVLYGSKDSKSSCRTVTLALKPFGSYNVLKRISGSTNLQLSGWTIDPDTSGSLSVALTLDGKAYSTITASVQRPDVAKVYPGYGSAHGMSAVVKTDAGEHTVCATAKNVGGGSDASLGCKLIIAVHPKAPSTPRTVGATAGYGGATVTWTAPASDGGAPWTKYTVTASPGGAHVTVGASTTSATVLGLKPSTTYSFTVTATNVAGTSAAGKSPSVKTQASPPPQTTPAPVSTSRYIRNIRGSTAAEQATLRAEGASDAKANPSGHGYLVLLDIGGQDQENGGVVLSATTRFVAYADLVRDLQAYIDGYHSAQHASAPATIAVGTNNDMDVTTAAGQAWADHVVDPLVSYAHKYAGIVLAGANDIEPGFRASYAATKNWLAGYLHATSAPFVFNGSADGCSWTATARGCNNGWSMSGLYYLAAGAAPIRMLNLPQVYNNTMADQWKYISLTGVAQKSPRINFAGTLTEWTACDQTNSCGSITGHAAWSRLWSNLQSDTRLKVGSLPYSTDLRIDR